MRQHFDAAVLRRSAPPQCSSVGPPWAWACLETGATAGLYLRSAGMPVYGFVGIFYDVDVIRSHGEDERIGVRELYDGLEFEYRMVKPVSSPSA